MKKIILLIFFALPAISWSQNSILKGKLTDKSTGLPLVGASITTAAGGTTTDKDGVFSMDCTGSINLVISYVGYETMKQSISDCSAELSISLNPSTQVLNEIEITATSNQNKLILSQPASIAKLGATEIKRGTGLFMDDVINANIPGVFMQRRTISAGQQFNIRGYGGGGPGNRGTNNNFDQLGVKAYLNGIPITDAEGITLMDDIDFGSIGNVEIIKGPAGSLYGLAIAGVINLQTIKPEKNKTSIGQDVLFGSYGLNRFTTHLHTSTEKSSLLINYGKQNYSGFAPHTASTKDFVNVMGDFQLSDKQSMTAYVGWSNSYDQRNGELDTLQYSTFDYSGNPAYIKNDAHTNVVSLRTGLGHTYRFSKNISNTTSIFGTGLNSNVSSAGGWTDKAPVNYGFRSVFDLKFDFSSTIRLSGITGIEAQKQHAQVIAYNMVANAADPGGYNVIGSQRSNQSTITATYSIFTQWTLSLPRDFSFTAGIGISNMDILLRDKLYVATNNNPNPTVPTLFQNSYSDLISPSLALNKLINKHISVYASCGKGYRAPVASNIYTPLAGSANTGLKPEQGNQFEVGSKGSLLNDRLVYEVAYFNSKFSNKMTYVGVLNAAGTATAYSYVTNSGSLNNSGLELLVKYTALQSDAGFVKALRPFINATYSDFKYESFTLQTDATKAVADFSGKAVAGVPPITANLGADFVSNVGMYASANYQYRDVMPFTPDGKSKATSYNLLNAKIGFRKTFAQHFDLDAYIGANNITSQQYYQMVFVNQLPDAYLPAPKDINYFGGINLKYIF
jgi:iron complex outermembrane recepter protein